MALSTIQESLTQPIRELGLEKAQIDLKVAPTFQRAASETQANPLTMVKLKFDNLSDKELLQTFIAASENFAKVADDSKKAWDINGLTIQQPTLDWYTGGSIDGFPLGSGGPGKRHVNTVGLTSADLVFSGATLDKVLSSGEGVDVYILDSFPIEQQNIPAGLNWEGIKREFDALTRGNPPDQQEPRLPTYPNDVNDMPSHGLFIEGIITSIAPNANIIRVPVLNERCIGTMITLALGLDFVTLNSASRNRPFVVNMSLVFARPERGLITSVLDGVVGAQQIVSGLDMDLGDLSRAWSIAVQITRLLLSAARVFQTNGEFVAASGNERDGALLPVPNYPAIEDRVFGVGALTQDAETTSYTNMADMEGNVYPGFWVFGGDYVDNTNGDGGILGRIPPSLDIISWAGTSFSTGVVSGVQARLLSAGGGQTLSDVSVPYQITDPATGNLVNVGWRLEIKQG
jgi:hypothetical protein